MTTVAINNSAASDEEHAIDVIVLAFSADPAARRMFPETKTRKAVPNPRIRA